MAILFKKVFPHLLLLPFLWLISTNASGDSAAVRVYQIPMGELKHLVVNRLEQSGHEVAIRESGMGKVDLTFHHSGYAYKIELRPESALATRITFSGEKKDARFLKIEEDLWAFVNAYAGPGNTDVERDLSNEYIPRVIYSKTGSVVCINTQSNGMSSQFSGFVIDAKGRIICTAHDLKKYKTIEIVDHDGRGYLGKVVRLDLTRDLALIESQLKPRGYIPLSQGRERLRKNEKIYAIGCPMNQLGKISMGSVTTTPVKANRLRYWKVLLKTSPGSSGSPVFDAGGSLVGMVKGRYRGTNTIGFLIPVDRIRAFLNEP